MSATPESTYSLEGMRLVLMPEQNAVLPVRCEGDVILPGFRPEQDPLAQLLGPGAFSRKVVLDLERVNLLDTTGVSWLVNCSEQFRQGGGLLILHSVPVRVGYLFKLLNLDQVLAQAASRAAALALATGEPT